MIHPDEKTFTSGEFAKLLGISKQAISLYEREISSLQNTLEITTITITHYLNIVSWRL